MKLVVFGGTGYAGAAMVAEAAEQGFDVVAVSRHEPAAPIDGVTYVQGSLLDAAFRAQVAEGADVVYMAMSPRGDMEGKLAAAYIAYAKELAGRARLIVLGGFGSMRIVAGGPRIADTDEFPAEVKPEVHEMAEVLDYLTNEAPAELEWLYVSPASSFGGFNPGEKTGNFVVAAGDVATFDANGESNLSSQDLALAIVDELSEPKYHNQHISVRN